MFTCTVSDILPAIAGGSPRVTVRTGTRGARTKITLCPSLLTLHLSHSLVLAAALGATTWTLFGQGNAATSHVIHSRRRCLATTCRLCRVGPHFRFQVRGCSWSSVAVNPIGPGLLGGGPRSVVAMKGLPVALLISHCGTGSITQIRVIVDGRLLPRCPSQVVPHGAGEGVGGAQHPLTVAE